MTQAQHTRIALITGASRGLGRSMALHLADHGVDVVVTYNAHAKAADEVVAAIEAKGRKALALPLDVGDASSFEAFAATLDRELPRVFGRETLDVLVNNAGVGYFAPIGSATIADFDRIVSVHLKGVLFLTQALLPRIADGGRILNVSSGLTRMTLPGYSTYGAVKGAVEVLTRYLAQELGPRRIAVNVIAPGAIETDFGGGRVRDDAALNAMIASHTALGRVGLPDDIGAAVAMLLAPGGHWMTGQRIEVSGGQGL